MDELLAQLTSGLGTTYSVERELGGGGMSRVFLAMERSLDRQVVVKVLPRDTASRVSAERFRREIALAARLQHPHIVPLLTAGESGGLPYFTMPYIEGESLRARLTRDGRFPVADAIRLMREVASALAYAHARGVVHRDIKPENVLLTEQHALVADFGVAKALHLATESDASGLTSVGIALGTPAYMAPEQGAADPDVDHRADLYAFGVVAYEILTGAPPFAGRSPQAMIAAHIIEAPAPITSRRSEIPASLATLIMRCLEKQPDDRPQGAADILRELDRISSGSAARVVERPSVAVLPMVNTDGDSDSEHFSDGLTDELIGALSQVSELTVSGRTSVFALKGKGFDVRTIANLLHVEHILEGSVRRAGNRLKVRVQLVNPDCRVLWSQAYDRTITDVFAVQEEIAQAVVRALEVTLSAGRGPLVRPPTADMAAYDLYLKGRFVRRRFTPDDFRRAIKYFEQAIEHDSKYARAYAAISDLTVMLAVFAGIPASQALPQARATAAKAVELDPMLADAHWAVAHVAFALDLDFPTAEREFRRAIAEDPGHVDARHMYGIYLLDYRRFAESEAELLHALEIDPLLAEVKMTLGRVYVFSGRAGRALPYLLDALELSPDFNYAREQLVHAYLQLGRFDEAIAESERAAVKGGSRETAVLAYACAVAGDRERAVTVLRTLTDDTTRYAPPCHIAMVYAALGDNDAALMWLERATAEHDPHIAGLKILPAFEALHADERFTAIARRLNLDH